MAHPTENNRTDNILHVIFLKDLSTVTKHNFNLITH